MLNVRMAVSYVCGKKIIRVWVAVVLSVLIMLTLILGSHCLTISLCMTHQKIVWVKEPLLLGNMQCKAMLLMQAISSS
jgi:hypothetical protein